MRAYLDRISLNLLEVMCDVVDTSFIHSWNLFIYLFQIQSVAECDKYVILNEYIHMINIARIAKLP